MDRRTFHTIIWLCIAALLSVTPGCKGRKKDTDPIKDVARFFAPRPSYVREYYAHTKDNWKIALHRYAPERSIPGRMSVLLCHGLGHNGHFWDLDAPHNFAEYLRDVGWDTWIIDMRGGGESSKPIWYWMHGPDLTIVKHLDMDPTKLDWNLENYIFYDAPAALELIKRETGSTSVAWIGHSLGGIIGLCWLERAHAAGQDPGIGCFVGVATPMIVPQPPTMFQRDFKYFNIAAAAVNNRWQALFQRATLGQFPTPLDVFYYNQKNMDALTIQLLYLRVVEDVPVTVLEQLLKMAQCGELVSPDGKFNYSKELWRVSVPVLFIAGKGDHSADPEAVHYAYEHVSSKDKTFRTFGLAWGDSIDYGHDDLILGKRARQEVFPFIASWLEGRAVMHKMN